MRKCHEASLRAAACASLRLIAARFSCVESSGCAHLKRAGAAVHVARIPAALPSVINIRPTYNAPCDKRWDVSGILPTEPLPRGRVASFTLPRQPTGVFCLLCTSRQQPMPNAVHLRVGLHLHRIRSAHVGIEHKLVRRCVQLYINTSLAAHSMAPGTYTAPCARTPKPATPTPPDTCTSSTRPAATL
jgi:hypothetical protein